MIVIASAIDATVTKNNGVAHIMQQSPKLIVDNQVVCSDIASPIAAAVA